MPINTPALQSKVCPAQPCTQPFRVVLHQNEKNEWVTHVENMAAVNGEFKEKEIRDLHWGHYFMEDYEGARKDYDARCTKYGLV